MASSYEVFGLVHLVLLTLHSDVTCVSVCISVRAQERYLSRQMHVALRAQVQKHAISSKLDHLIVFALLDSYAIYALCSRLLLVTAPLNSVHNLLIELLCAPRARD